MIRRMLAALRDLRIAHHHRRACAEGVAILQAQQRRDWQSAGEHLLRMHAHQDKRDRLATKRGPAARPDPVTSHQVARAVCCGHACREGRDCPARSPRRWSDVIQRHHVAWAVVILTPLFWAAIHHFTTT